jgi:hypothetical protein
MPTVTANIVLAPDRRRLAKSIYKALLIAAASDQKLYARGKTFLPIFPTNDTALQSALTIVIAQLELVTTPA